MFYIKFLDKVQFKVLLFFKFLFSYRMIVFTIDHLYLIKIKFRLNKNQKKLRILNKKKKRHQFVKNNFSFLKNTKLKKNVN